MTQYRISSGGSWGGRNQHVLTYIIPAKKGGKPIKGEALESTEVSEKHTLFCFLRAIENELNLGLAIRIMVTNASTREGLKQVLEEVGRIVQIAKYEEKLGETVTVSSETGEALLSHLEAMAKLLS